MRSPSSEVRAGIGRIVLCGVRRFSGVVVLLSLVTAVHAAEDPAAVTPAPVFGDHMVLQRDKPVPIWGTAAPGEEVTVAFAEQMKTVTADKDGKWKVVLDPMEASAEGRVLKVGAKEIKDVLVGEVWIGSGQSNMQWDFAMLTGLHEKARALADNPLIRYTVNIEKDYSTKPDKYPGAIPVQKDTWTVMSKSTFYNCSAAMFFFAARLQQELQVPVGVVVAAMGATRVAQWTPAEVFNKDERCKADLEYYRSLLAAFEKQAFRMPTNRDLRPKPFDDSVVGDPMAGWERAGNCYNAYIRRLVPLAVRGVCWDQGEHGSGHTGLGLQAATAAMVNGWRREWGCKASDLPFIQVQKPSGFGDGGVQKKRSDLPVVGAPMLDLGVEPQENWQVQEMCPYVFTANSMDPAMAGYHPPAKDLYGYRLADMALSCFYKEPEPHQTPVVQTCAFADGKAVLAFKEVGEGLQSMDGEPLRGFFIAAADRVYFPAQAEIVGKNEVRVWADEVKEPALVMYAVKGGLGNLASSDKLFAFPYRSEPWAMPDSEAVEARVWPILQQAEPGPVQEAAAQVLWQMGIRDAECVGFIKEALEAAIVAGNTDHSIALMVLLARHVETGSEAVRPAAKAAFLEGLEKGTAQGNFTFLVGSKMKFRVSNATIEDLMESAAKDVAAEKKK